MSSTSRRRSSVPGFKYAYVERSGDFGRAHFSGGPRGGSQETKLQIMEEIADAIVGCFPGTTRDPARKGRDEDEDVYIQVGAGGGRPSYYVYGDRYGGVSLRVSVWLPGRYAAFQRSVEERNRRYTSVGCSVGDDLCLTRRTVGR